MAGALSSPSSFLRPAFFCAGRGPQNAAVGLNRIRSSDKSASLQSLSLPFIPESILSRGRACEY